MINTRTNADFLKAKAKGHIFGILKSVSRV